MKADMLVKIKGQLIVSCQALENEPLHSAWIMSRMAAAAAEGGAAAIRANSLPDVQQIMETIDLPVIAICKRDYDGSEVFITATLREVGNGPNLLIVFYVQIMPDDFIMQLHRF